MHDVNELRRQAKTLVSDSDAMTDLAFSQYYAIRTLSENLDEAVAALSNGRLDLSGYTATAIVDAVMALEDRRSALVRTWLDGRLEQRRGRRSGRSGGTPAASGNGHAAQFRLDL